MLTGKVGTTSECKVPSDALMARRSNLSLANTLLLSPSLTAVLPFQLLCFVYYILAFQRRFPCTAQNSKRTDESFICIHTRTVLHLLTDLMIKSIINMLHLGSFSSFKPCLNRGLYFTNGRPTDRPIGRVPSDLSA